MAEPVRVSSEHGRQGGWAPSRRSTRGTKASLLVRRGLGFLSLPQGRAVAEHGAPAPQHTRRDSSRARAGRGADREGHARPRVSASGSGETGRGPGLHANHPAHGSARLRLLDDQQLCLRPGRGEAAEHSDSRTGAIHPHTRRRDATDHRPSILARDSSDGYWRDDRVLLDVPRA